jgi:hypothetical protein
MLTATHTPTLKTKYVYAIVLALAFIGLFLLFGFYFHNWIIKFLPEILLLSFEYGTRCRQAGKVLLPAFKLPTFKRQQAAQAAPIHAPICTDISKIKIRTFIACSIDEDLTALGNGTERELSNAYNRIISDYFQARGDEAMKREIKLSAELLALEFRSESIKTNIELIHLNYNEVAADLLRYHYKHYKLTPETYIEDCRKIMQEEIRCKIQADRIRDRLQKIAEDRKPTIELSRTQKMQSFTEELMSIRKFENISMSVDSMINDMSILELATSYKRLSAHIEALNEQVRKNRK